MITFGKTASKPNFLFGPLPNYFKEKDSYKDGNNEGLLERYLEIFCTEIDNELSPYLDEVLSITDAEQLSTLKSPTSDDLIQHLSSLFGNPPDIGSEIQYIKLIRYIKYILQTKGTLQALIYYLAIYDYEIDNLTESAVEAKIYDLSPTPLAHDSGGTYDVGFIFYSGYDLIITDKAGTSTKNPTQSWLDNYLKPAIQKFINPIWAELGIISYTP